MILRNALKDRYNNYWEILNLNYHRKIFQLYPTGSYAEKVYGNSTKLPDSRIDDLLLRLII